MQDTPRRYLVTGASSGIGLAMVKRLYGQGHAVVGTGARPLHDLPVDYPDIPYLQANQVGDFDLTVTNDVDRVIMAAGTGFYRPLSEETAGSVANVLQVNVGAVVQLLHRLHPVLEKNGGRVALLGSIAARGAAGMPIYAASKGALAGLARCLSSEWRGRIVVRHFALWPVRTPMHARAGYDARRIDFMLMDSDAVAAHILWAIERPGRASSSINPATLLQRRLAGRGR